jgi:hypothetical protein
MAIVVVALAVYVGLFLGIRRHGYVSSYADENGNFAPPKTLVFFYFSQNRTANKALFCLFYPIHSWMRPAYYPSTITNEAFAKREGGWFRIAGSYYLYDTHVFAFDGGEAESDQAADSRRDGAAAPPVAESDAGAQDMVETDRVAEPDDGDVATLPVAEPDADTQLVDLRPFAEEINAELGQRSGFGWRLRSWIGAGGWNIWIACLATVSAMVLGVASGLTVFASLIAMARCRKPGVSYMRHMIGPPYNVIFIPADLTDERLAVRRRLVAGICAFVACWSVALLVGRAWGIFE